MISTIFNWTDPHHNLLNYMLVRYFMNRLLLYFALAFSHSKVLIRAISQKANGFITVKIVLSAMSKIW